MKCTLLLPSNDMVFDQTILEERDCPARPTAKYCRASKEYTRKSRYDFESLRFPNAPENGWPVACEYCNQLFTPKAHRSRGGARIYLRGDQEVHLGSSTKPGDMWYCPWYWDPIKPDVKERRDAKLAAADWAHTMLSIHYFQDWALIRPPICVKCPNGSEWVVDQKSSTGSGWKVTGEAPNITCHPSIVAGDYHGWLENGIFRPA